MWKKKEKESKRSKKSNPAWRKLKELGRKAISNSGDRGGVKPKINRPVTNAETQSALRPNAQFGLQRRKADRRKADY